ncbi:MAG: hypothetical protein ACM3JD_18075, partial [Rudaea sp.]
WVDRLLGWIDRLPIPAWVLYPVVLVLTVLIINAARWVEGNARFGALDAPFAFVAFYPIANLAAIHYLDRTARRAFDSFRLALGRSDEEAERFKYQLTVLPARGALLAAAAGLGLMVLVVVGAIGSQEAVALGLGPYFWSLVICAFAGMAITAELLYHTVRQLGIVSRIHEAATNVDLYHFSPLYSFSALTARTGLVFGLNLWFDLAINPETMSSPPLIALNAALLVLGAACFLLPLEGMHRRIVVEKRRLEGDVNQRIQVLVGRLYERVDGNELGDADAMNKMMNSLIATRELIGKVPAWPWRPETFTVFFSALTLPVVVFVIQMALKASLGFK